MPNKKQLLSVVIPCYNESGNVVPFYKNLESVLSGLTLQDLNHEIIYVNDGSTDDTLNKLHNLADRGLHIKIVDLSRNFGKEIATSAGIHFATGDAIITIDADGQHPVKLIPEFIKQWQAGAQVVTGIRDSYQREGWTKRYGSTFLWTMESANRLNACG